jgi:toxin ParE1/3/4
MSFEVLLTKDAERDLEDLYTYIFLHDSPEKAAYVLDRIEEAFSSLNENPERGAYPGKLPALGIREYREVFFKPYRILFKVISGRVYVVLIADGRRDMQALLQRRVLEG